MRVAIPPLPIPPILLHEAYAYEQLDTGPTPELDSGKPCRRRKGEGRRQRAYLDLLARADNPRKGDDARLREVCGKLGIGLEEVEADAAALGKMQALRERVTARTGADLAEAQNKAAMSLQTHSEAARKRFMADEAETTRLMGELRSISHARDEWTNAQNELKALQEANPRLATGG